MRILFFLLLTGCVTSEYTKTSKQTYINNLQSNPCKELNMDCFKKLVHQTNFREDSSVIWYPELPTYNEQILIFYNPASKNSRFSISDNIIFSYASYSDTHSSNEITKTTTKKPMKKTKDGLFYLSLSPKEIDDQGFITFRAKDKPLDNNYGSPWKLAKVDKLPSYEKVETKLFNYYYLKEDINTIKNIESIIKKMNSSLKLIFKQTDLKFNFKFDFYYYFKRDLILKYQANRGNNYEAYRNRVYSCESQTDMHEIVHLLFNQLGQHVGILDEGVAIHYGQELVSDGWRGKTCNWWASKFKEENKLPKLENIFTPSGFYMAKWDIVGGIHYPVACSFTSFLIKSYGLESFKKLFSRINPNNQHDFDKVNELFLSIYKKNIQKIEKEWLSSI